MSSKCGTRFARALRDPAAFALTFELVPSRGARSKEQARSLEIARRAAADGRICAVSITENAGGHPALSPEVLGLEIRRLELDVIIHVSCKDKNRNQMESLLFAWSRENLHNLLVVTGDYPKEGFRGFPKPVFDFDSVHALDLLGQMNKGLAPGTGGRAERLPVTYFFKGVALSPFKRLEAEVLMQYAKLHRKKAAGADYVITQVGYDARKLHEVLLYMRAYDCALPVLGNVFIPSLAVARLMHEGAIPGCVITDRLRAEIEAEARDEDGGKRARLLRAAKLLAILKGMGYDGAHIGGPIRSFDDLAFVLDRFEAYAPGWQDLVPEFSYEMENGFYLYQKDPSTGLNREDALPGPRSRGRRSLAYRVAAACHDLMFTPAGRLYAPMKKLCLAVQGSGLEPLFARLEHGIKLLGFGCRNCGDCTLAELAYRCPQSGCAKYILNGPCGGSRDGWCEVYPGRRPCLYVLVYERLRAEGREGRMRCGLVPPRNWSLNDTSSWINFFSGRDHHAGKEPGS